MKPTAVILLFISSIFSLSCSPSGDDSQSLPHQVAKAYGYENLDNINSIKYTWNVRRDSVTVDVRDWAWDLKKNEVYYSGPDTTATYLTSQKDSSLESIDKKFINDKYWFLFPFHLAWDTGYEHEIIEEQKSPIHGENTTKLIIRYNDTDGYTPGDAYDLYLDDQNMIKEWVFRRGDGPEGRAFTWENVQEQKGIKFAVDHKNAEGEKFIWFSDVEVQ